MKGNERDGASLNYYYLIEQLIVFQYPRKILPAIQGSNPYIIPGASDCFIKHTHPLLFILQKP
jgi:hypothetical protein